ncbi:MAG: T9SS type A sorting domain-containing protein [Ferruginibacter sp.]
MAFLRNCILLILCLYHLELTAQAVHYPAYSSNLLRSTSADIASLFKKAIPNSSLTTSEYGMLPATGIIFIYDSTITDNQLCKVESDGVSFLKITAAQDNGLVFGIYQYLDELGFRFYQPGEIWEIIPTLNSPYKNCNKIYNNQYKYRNWFISGGHTKWLMDNNPAYSWDIYAGELGHNWAVYQRRNGMQGAYSFNGHRGDIMTGNYLNALQNNPCYVASFNDSRQVTASSVPDINNSSAKDLWSNTIEQKFNQYRNTIYNNKVLYADLYRNFNYRNKFVGIEVPDGPRWGNSSTAISGCSGNTYPLPSDQNIILANHTAQNINGHDTVKNFQVYAYSSHADVPSSSLNINTKIDIQVISTAFQSETSSKGLLNRWYKKFKNISEYHYLNIPQWGGETPMVYLNEMKNTLSRLSQQKSQGIVWETSPAKFSSLPLLRASNKYLLDSTAVDAALLEFTNNMFGPASPEIFKLLQFWSDENTITTGAYLSDNKYKLPLYISLLNEAVIKTQNSPEVIKQRLRELKVYLHYMVLYYNWLSDTRNNNDKAGMAGALCLYLAKISKMQIVNSYYLIIDHVSKFPESGSFYSTYNAFTGSAYLNGNLPLITNEEIEADFNADFNYAASMIPKYDLKDPEFISNKMLANNLTANNKINVKLTYTNGTDYPNRSIFYINAKGAGNFTIDYLTKFNMATKGRINFTLEKANDALGIIEDVTLNRSAVNGTLTFQLPVSGTYKLSIVSLYQSALDITIHANGNLFYKNTAFLGSKTENYRSDLSSLPGYYYVPSDLQKVYFSIHNSFGVTAVQLTKAFEFRDNAGNSVTPVMSDKDSALFYFTVPSAQSGTFWQIYKMEQYDLCFANISNVQWYVKKACSNAPINLSIVKKGDVCITRLTTSAPSAALKWEVIDNGNIVYYTSQNSVDLPDYTSPKAVINLYTGTLCISSKNLAQHPGYMSQRESCALGAPLPLVNERITVGPNPSRDVFRIIKEGTPVIAEDILIYNAQGTKILSLNNTTQIDLSSHPAGVYYYKMRVSQAYFSGKLVKL